MAIPKETIVAAVMNARAWDLVNAHFGGSYERFVDECGITKQDLIAWVERNGFPKGWVHLAPATFDGMYIVEKDGYFVLYYQERGVIEERSMEFFRSYGEARDRLLDHYMPKKR